MNTVEIEDFNSELNAQQEPDRFDDLGRCATCENTQFLNWTQTECLVCEILLIKNRLAFHTQQGDLDQIRFEIVKLEKATARLWEEWTR